MKLTLSRFYSLITVVVCSCIGLSSFNSYFRNRCRMNLQWMNESAYYSSILMTMTQMQRKHPLATQTITLVESEIKQVYPWLLTRYSTSFLLQGPFLSQLSILC